MQNELAEISRMAQPNVSRTISSLVKKGLVAKKDRTRNSSLVLSGKGKNITAEALDRMLADNTSTNKENIK